MTRVAVVQQPPVFLDKSATAERAAGYVEEAAGNGANLLIFPEAFIPGYPAWIWRLRPGGDWGLAEQIHERLLANAVTLSSDDLRPLLDAARSQGVTVLCGMDERDGELSQATLYNTVVLIGPDGRVLNRHRKLMPTNPERMVWGLGDASGLNVTETPAGRVGALICWENYMPLARYALYGQGVELYVAPTYDSGDGWIGTMRHIATEAGCWVISSGTALRASDIPEDFPQKATLYPDPGEWVNAGDSVVIAPGGEVLAGPLRNEQAILYCDVEPDRVALARRTLDVAGHYARPDIFQLYVNRQPQRPVHFDN